jgi:hypothetical protein
MSSRDHCYTTTEIAAILSGVALAAGPSAEPLTIWRALARAFNVTLRTIDAATGQPVIDLPRNDASR